jgi:PEP-CTERM motif
MAAVFRKLTVALAMATLGTSALADLNFTFDTGAQGVTATGGQLQWVSQGFLSLRDVDSADMAIVLPATAPGNGLTYLGSTFSFDAINRNESLTDWGTFGTLRFTAADGQFVERDVVPGFAPDVDWQTFSTVLDEATWGPALAAVLPQLASVTLVLESHQGYDITNGGAELIGVDNIRLAATPPVPEPSTWAIALTGLAGLAVASRARQRRQR